ncbi:hypothetical protein LAV79_22815 [Peribacillus butanolivorans]|uniref:hypothetical protein n=1 Tax=Peribacillus butanolivorans TaxID=421767 RepID=UPI0030C90DBB
MNVLISALPSLLGVAIGGLITFFIQQSITRKQQTWDKEKMILDILNKKETTKFEVFNKILHMNAKYPVLEYDIHRGPELNEKEYIERIRPLLYEIYHLLAESIVYEVENIEDIYERHYVLEAAEVGDDEVLALSYMKIMKLIKQEFKDLRESTAANLTIHKIPKKKWKWNSWFRYSEEEIREIEAHRKKNQKLS